MTSTVATHVTPSSSQDLRASRPPAPHGHKCWEEDLSRSRLRIYVPRPIGASRIFLAARRGPMTAKASYRPTLPRDHPSSDSQRTCLRRARASKPIQLANLELYSAAVRPGCGRTSRATVAPCDLRGPRTAARHLTHRVEGMRAKRADAHPLRGFWQAPGYAHWSAAPS
ncbi:hypothetical protein BC834DRAFT_409912 [Gloeopeniophorella convolvens]|nr:hypothetical protein BC834DRAFT_409912 [Gloeopeniophorella convolvens]